MKRIILILLIFSYTLTFSQSLDNKNVVEKLFLEGWNNKKFEGLKNYIGDTVLFHFNNIEFITNSTDLEQMIFAWHDAFENFRFEILHLIQEGDIVAINLRFKGKQVNDFMGIESNGKEIDVSEMMFFRFEEGKIVEAWELYDEPGMKQQMKNSN